MEQCPFPKLSLLLRNHPSLTAQRAASFVSVRTNQHVPQPISWVLCPFAWPSSCMDSSQELSFVTWNSLTHEATESAWVPFSVLLRHRRWKDTFSFQAPDVTVLSDSSAPSYSSRPHPGRHPWTHLCTQYTSNASLSLLHEEEALGDTENDNTLEMEAAKRLSQECCHRVPSWWLLHGRAVGSTA